jgi:Predicted membrane protein (DUF2157)
MANSTNTSTFSIYWEIRALLYLGVLSLSSGLGILVYKNIETLGHQTILFVIGLLTASCFGFCFKRAEPFTAKESASTSSLSDYILLLGVLLFGIFIGYLQFKYRVFGNHHDLAIGAPALFYLYLAYRFDHRAVLQLAISGICAALGLAITPLSIISQGLFHYKIPIYLGLGIGGGLFLIGAASEKFAFKSHFSFSYIHFAIHITMIAGLAGMITGGPLGKLLFFILLAIGSLGIWKYARLKNSAYFLLCAVLYGYISITYLIMHMLFQINSLGSETAYLVFSYFLLSCAGTIYFFLNLKTMLGNKNAGLPKE